MKMTSPNHQLESIFSARRAIIPEGHSRAILEVKSSHIPTEIYEARLKGYVEAKVRSAVSKRPEKGDG